MENQNNREERGRERCEDRARERNQVRVSERERESLSVWGGRGEVKETDRQTEMERWWAWGLGLLFKLLDPDVSESRSFSWTLSEWGPMNYQFYLNQFE